MPLQATLPLSVVNVPNDYFSMAGFEVTLHGGFCVTPEEPLQVANLIALHARVQRDQHNRFEPFAVIKLFLRLRLGTTVGTSVARSVNSWVTMIPRTPLGH